MPEIFDDLSGLGLSSVENIEIYKKKAEQAKIAVKATGKTIKDIVYDRTISCPVCTCDIKFKSVKSRQLKLEKIDLDLRPIYDLLDPALYDVIACNTCGYAALKKVFHKITPLKQKLFKERVAKQFIGKPYPESYTYDIAIERYKLALYDAIIIDTKDSEKAYICLKISWLYRGFYESVENLPDDGDRIALYKTSELAFMKHAVDGFKIAYEKENFPVLDLDEITIVFLIGELSRRLGEFDEANKWLSQVILSNVANSRLKDRARNSRDLIIKAKSAE